MFLTTPAGAAFACVMAPLIDRYQIIEQTVPGGIAQAVKDAGTFFETEVPGAPSWTFGPEQAAAITCPVLSVLGTRSSPQLDHPLTPNPSFPPSKTATFCWPNSTASPPPSRSYNP